jgi:DNA-binding transcriptional LysR family regulator
MMLAPKPIPPSVFAGLPITALVMGLIGLLFSVLRITVTGKEILVQYGLFGPKIPIDRIQSCKAIVYNWRDYGGWGIRRGADGSWAYNMMGDAGRAVRVEWTDEKGNKQVTLLASRDPEALARAVAEARGVALVPKLRVAPDPRLAEFQAEAEAEAESVLEEENKKNAGEAGGGPP